MIRFLFTAALSVFAASAHAEVEIREVTSPGGINAWLVEDHEIPFLALEIQIKGGASLDLPGARGAVNLMTGLLEEGSGDMDARTFQATREGLAASFGFDVYDDSFSVSARVLSENRGEAMALLRDALVNPTFDNDAVERVRAQVLSIIASDEKNPNRLASAAFNLAAFRDHPYGSSLNGTVESVGALTREDLIAAHQNVVTRDRIYVGAVGDITAAELGALLDDLLADLPETSAPLSPDVPFGLGGGITVVPFETPQSVAYFGHQGIKRDDEDFFAAYILNTILGGGGFESRLMQEVREKRGLTYGVYTHLVPKENGEMMIGSVASGNDRIGETIAVIRDEWARLSADGVTAEELDGAKTYLTGAYPLRFDGNAPIAGILVGMQMQDLPPDYVINRNALVEAVTLDDVNRVAAELLRPDDLHFVVVGQPVGLESTN